MIDYACPKCGEALSVPASLAGQSQGCPGCGNVSLVPQKRNVLIIARVYDCTVATARRFWALCKRRRKLASLVVVNVLVVGGLLGWMLPDWMPRPVFRIETPAEDRKGMFPPRVELAQILAEKGYHLYPKTEVAALRGRALRRYSYVLDARSPFRACIHLACPLDDASQVVAISTTVFAPSSPPDGVPGQRAFEAEEVAHSDHLRLATAAIERACGLSLSATTLRGDGPWRRPASGALAMVLVEAMGTVEGAGGIRADLRTTASRWPGTNETPRWIHTEVVVTDRSWGPDR